MAAPSPPAADQELVDYSWSAFWPWARDRGLNGPREIENLIGQQVAGLSPAELRDLILAATAADRPHRSVHVSGTMGDAVRRRVGCARSVA